MSWPELGDDLDLRTDVPRYCIWRDGALAETTDDITTLWRDARLRLECLGAR